VSAASKVLEMAADFGRTDSRAPFLLGFFAVGFPSRRSLKWLIGHLTSMASGCDSHVLLQKTIDLAGAFNISVADVLQAVQLVVQQPAGMPPPDGLFIFLHSLNGFAYVLSYRPCANGRVDVHANQAFSAQLCAPEQLRALWAPNEYEMFSCFLHPDDISLVPYYIGRFLMLNATDGEHARHHHGHHVPVHHTVQPTGRTVRVKVAGGLLLHCHVAVLSYAAKEWFYFGLCLTPYNREEVDLEARQASSSSSAAASSSPTMSLVSAASTSEPQSVSTMPRFEIAQTGVPMSNMPIPHGTLSPFSNEVAPSDAAAPGCESCDMKLPMPEAMSSTAGLFEDLSDIENLLSAWLDDADAAAAMSSDGSKPLLGALSPPTSPPDAMWPHSSAAPASSTLALKSRHEPWVAWAAPIVAYVYGFYDYGQKAVVLGILFYVDAPSLLCLLLMHYSVMYVEQLSGRRIWERRDERRDARRDERRDAAALVREDDFHHPNSAPMSPHDDMDPRSSSPATVTSTLALKSRHEPWMAWIQAYRAVDEEVECCELNALIP